MCWVRGFHSINILLFVEVLFIAVLKDIDAVNVLGRSSCPTEGTQFYKNLEWKHCSNTQRLHCQKDENSRVVSFCHTPVLCGIGTFAKLASTSESVICEACPDGYYQPVPRYSYEFTKQRCLRQHVTCDTVGKVLCKAGTAKSDYRCTCDYALQYAPSSENCDCFSYDDPCYCKRKSCGQGKQLNSTFHCVAIPTTPTTTTTTTTTIKATTTTTRPIATDIVLMTKEDLSPVAIFGIVIGILLTVMIAIIIVFKLKRRRSRKESIIGLFSRCLKQKDPVIPKDQDSGCRQNSSKDKRLLSGVNPTSDDPSDKAKLAVSGSSPLEGFNIDSVNTENMQDQQPKTIIINNCGFVQLGDQSNAKVLNDKYEAGMKSGPDIPLPEENMADGSESIDTDAGEQTEVKEYEAGMESGPDSPLLKKNIADDSEKPVSSPFSFGGKPMGEKPANTPTLQESETDGISLKNRKVKTPNGVHGDPDQTIPLVVA